MAGVETSGMTPAGKRRALKRRVATRLQQMPGNSASASGSGLDARLER